MAEFLRPSEIDPNLINRIRDAAVSIVDSVPRPIQRCHEFSRFLHTEIGKRGIQTQLKDGVVAYDVPTLVRESFHFFDEQMGWQLGPEELEAYVKDSLINSQKQVKIQHSWLELPTPTSAVVIDWQNVIRIRKPDLTIDENLIVDDKNSLPHEYKANALYFGRFMVIPALRYPSAVMIHKDK